jgi:hypothetical protein
MDEQQIVEQLRQNIPQPPSTPSPNEPDVTTDEQSSFIFDSNAELGLLKLGSELGLAHADEAANDRLKFIYEQMVALAGSNSFDSVLALVNDTLVRLGLKFKEDRFMRLYLWLKVNQNSFNAQRML